ncbi:MAG TPA: hypothetical protein VGS23_09370 [Thermoplasmata archaeon]|nr:hypothetical protein [Thermoplasmata archaeon]
MNSGAPAPAYRTGWLWLTLGFFLLTGTVGSACVVYGALGVWNGGLLPFVPVGVVGGFAAVVSFLLLAGMLYRVDRLRGVPHREVALFE